MPPRTTLARLPVPALITPTPPGASHALIVYRHAAPVCVAATCGYEIAALCSGGRLPTVSALQARYRPVGCALAVWLLLHFLRYPAAATRDSAAITSG